MNPFAPTPEPEDWRRDAACRGVDPNVFHPDRGEDQTHALAYCQRCSTVAPCLEFALEMDVPGVWGNTSHRERRKLRPAWRRARERRAS